MLSLFIYALWILSLVVSTYAASINITIDDTLGDPSTGQGVSYVPLQNWNTRDCSKCTARPDPTQTTNGTWHDTTFIPGSFVPNATMTFTGTAVYVYAILTHTFDHPAGRADMTFFIDDLPTGTFVQEPTGSLNYDYHALVFAKEGISLGTHTLKISGGLVTGQKSVVLLDSIAYTTDTQLSSVLQKSTSEPTPSPSSLPTLSHIESTNTISEVISATADTDNRDEGNKQKRVSPLLIAFAVVTSLVGTIIISLFIFWLLRRRRLRRSSSSLGPTPKGDSGPNMLQRLNPILASWLSPVNNGVPSTTTRAGLMPLSSPPPHLSSTRQGPVYHTPSNLQSSDSQPSLPSTREGYAYAERAYASHLASNQAYASTAAAAAAAAATSSVPTRPPRSPPKAALPLALSSPADLRHLPALPPKPSAPPTPPRVPRAEEETINAPRTLRPLPHPAPPSHTRPPRSALPQPPITSAGTPRLQPPSAEATTRPLRPRLRVDTGGPAPALPAASRLPPYGGLQGTPALAPPPPAALGLTQPLETRSREPSLQIPPPPTYERSRADVRVSAGGTRYEGRRVPVPMGARPDRRSRI